MTDCKIALQIETEFGFQVYHPTPDELRALDDAELSGVAREEEVDAAFRSFRGS